jgi:ubiquinone/menaquinone biosynthesis methyltransferase
MNDTDFGFRTVPKADKARMVRDVFDSIAGRYDLMNDAMSIGIHRLWKKQLTAQITPRPGQDFIDVAGGTGDIIFGIRDALERATSLSPQQSKLTICDINQSMLDVGRNRAIDRGWVDGFDWVCGNAESLPFEDQTFDVYTIAFGLRNVTDIDAALAEAWRVLRPGGRFFCLEFSKVDMPGLRKIYDVFSFEVIPRLGQALTGDRASYQYLVESIRRFPNQQALLERMAQAGMTRPSCRNLSGGIAAIHSARKI